MSKWTVDGFAGTSELGVPIVVLSHPSGSQERCKATSVERVLRSLNREDEFDAIKAERDAALERVKELEKALESAPLGRVDDDFNRGQNFVLRLYAPLLGCEHMPTHSNFKRSLGTALERVRVLSAECRAARVLFVNDPVAGAIPEDCWTLATDIPRFADTNYSDARRATDAAHALDDGAS